MQIWRRYSAQSPLFISSPRRGGDLKNGSAERVTEGPAVNRRTRKDTALLGTIAERTYFLSLVRDEICSESFHRQ